MGEPGIQFRPLSHDERERLRRELTGVAAKELVKRGDVYHVIRTLRTSNRSLASADYQAALRDVQLAVSEIAARTKGDAA